LPSLTKLEVWLTNLWKATIGEAWWGHFTCHHAHRHHGCVHKEIASTLEQAQLQQQKKVGQGFCEGSTLGVVKGGNNGTKPSPSSLSFSILLPKLRRFMFNRRFWKRKFKLGINMGVGSSA
jgi:hypothetical protein